MRIHTLTLLIATTITCSGTALSQVHQSTDEHGNPSFSDQPSKDSKTVELQQTNTTKAIKVTPQATKKSTSEPSMYQSFSITSPRDNSTLANGLYPFNVKFSLKPGLKKGHNIQLFIDGAEHSSGTSLSRQVASISRGKHSLSAKVIDSKGKVLMSSATITLTAYRPSSNSNNTSGGNRPGGPVHLPSRPGINPPPSRPGPGSR